MQLARIGIENFKSFGSVDLALAVQTLYAVVGVNRDEGGVDSNGAGKTSFYEAITWALFGQVPGRSIGASDVIRVGTKSCNVRLEFDDGFVVERSRGIGDSGELFLTLPGTTKPLDLAGPTNAQAHLFKYLGCSADSRKYALEDFVASVFLFVGRSGMAGGTLVNTTSVKERMEAISRFLRLRQIEMAHALAQQKVKDIQSKVDLIQAELKAVTDLVGSFSSYKKMKSDLESMTTRLELDKKQLTIVQARIKRTSRCVAVWKELTDQEARRDAHISEKAAEFKRVRRSIKASKHDSVVTGEIELELAKVRVKLSKFDEKVIRLNLEELVDQVTECEDKLSSIGKSLASLENRRAHYAEQFSEPASCPYCTKSIMVTSDGNVTPFKKSGVQKELDQIQKKVELLIAQEKEAYIAYAFYVDKLNGFQKRKDILDKWKSEETELVSRLQPLLVSTSRVQSDRKYWKQYLKRWNGIYAEMTESVQELAERTQGYRPVEELNKKLPALETQEDMLRSAVEHVKAGITGMTKDLDRVRGLRRRQKTMEEEFAKLGRISTKYSFWIPGFSNIRRALISEFLPALESETNILLTEMGTGMRVKIQLSIPKKSQKGLKEAFDIQVLRQKSWQSLQSLSKGESARVGMMLSIALKKLAKGNSHAMFGWLMCDEVADALDLSGIQLFVQTLSRLPYQIFISSHRDMAQAGIYQGTSAQILQVTKYKGTSSIEVLAA